MKHKDLNPTISPNPGCNINLQLLLLALICVALVLGCAQIRKVTYPDDFVYLEKKQLRSKMALLSFYMRQLDEVLLDHSIVGGDQQKRVLYLLNEMNDLTAELGGGVMTNHLVIDDYIDQFKVNVNIAIRDARANPPNYFALGRLAGSCAACHQYRD